MLPSLFYKAWGHLLRGYLFSLCISFVFGLMLLYVFHLEPGAIFQASSTRISYVVPVFDAGVGLGLDLGFIIFLWNSGGALVTMLFFFAYKLFDPERLAQPPRLLRTILCGKQPMRLLCYLPGCRAVEKEHLRRLYVWLMIPFLGIILLGFESGMMLAVGKELQGSYLASFISFLPHGIIEIPAIALAGAVTFSGHLLVKEQVYSVTSAQLFNKLAAYEKRLPAKKLAVAVVAALFAAGMIEAHVTTAILNLF